MKEQRDVTCPQVCVIGWDGADWRILRPLMAAGRLPNLARFLARSRYGDLLSTVPPVTAPAWTTFLTGVNPGRHALFTWQGRLNERLERPFLNASHVRARRLWDWLGDAGKRALFLNVPLTYPPASLHGVLVSGMLTPGVHVTFTHPPEVRERLLAAIPDYQVDVEMQHTERDRTSPQGMKAHLEEVRRATYQRVVAWRLLWEEFGPFDFAMMVFEGPDRVQHPLYGYAAGIRPADADSGWDERQSWVWEYYTFLDEQFGAILATLPEDTTVFLVSDHGFGPLEWEFCVNDWLAAQGWLNFQEHARRFYAPLRPLARRLKRLLPRTWVQRGREAFGGLKAIDWSRTLAYGGGVMEDGIWINLKGREPWGIVAPEAYESVRDGILTALRDVHLPDGRPLCRNVYRREEIYHGPYVDQAPDIVLDLNEGVRFTSLRAHRDFFRAVRPLGQGTHRRRGILAVAGPSILPGPLETPSSLVDMTPTILALMDIPVPDAAFDGHVIEAIVPTYRRTSQLPDEEIIEPEDFTSEEVQHIESHLRSLGYID